MQAKHLVEELMPPGWQHEQACSVCKASFNHTIDEIYERFYHMVLNFIWVEYFPSATSQFHRSFSTCTT
jgi:hypothetical protein